MFWFVCSVSISFYRFNGHTSTIYCQSLENHNRTYVEDIGHPTEVAVDWITKNIYYVNEMPDEQSYIQICHMAEKLCAIVVTGEHGNEINNIAVDPLAGLLFWTETKLSMDSEPTSSIHRADLSGSDPKILVQSELGYISGLAVNTIQRIVYWADDSSQVIESATYNGEKRTLMFTTEVKRPKRLVLFEDDLYWLTEHSGQITKCKMFGKLHRCENVHINVYDADYLTIMQQSRQREGPNPCEHHHCSHLCVITPRGAKCVCADGQVVSMNVPCKDEGKKIPAPRFILPEVAGAVTNVVKAEGPSEKLVETSHWSIAVVIISILVIFCVVATVYFMYKRQLINLKNLDISIHFQKPGFARRGATSTPKALSSLKPGEHEYVNPLQMTRTLSESKDNASVKESSFSGALKKIRAPSKPTDFSDSESEEEFPVGGKGDKVRLIP